MPKTFSEIENTLSPQRLGRYLTEARGSKKHVMRLYVWNAQICESFYFPSQFAEVAIRNRLHFLLAGRFRQDWHSDKALLSPLPDRFKAEIRNAIRDCTRDHGKGMTVNHIVCSLSLGFWCHLLTSNFDHILWAKGIAAAFPNVPYGTTRQDVYNKINQLRQWRNRIAHHGVVFDNGPMKEFQNIQTLVGWVCSDTLWFMKETNNVSRSINQKPRQ